MLLNECFRLETLEKEVSSVKDDRKALRDQLKAMETANRDKDNQQSQQGVKVHCFP